ncbi:hypothetical protein DM02DRAFT_326876 [Periconia macrospinosa]|uniref:Uncharacterized protein n=1 Tax=Periconia macrospinosa TaxID=97972 RepID=A0A2V1EBA7_9PLEO|nr:hypothetical protein DM02DRAFT_326876 [Periconia macrospinosa]
MTRLWKEAVLCCCCRIRPQWSVTAHSDMLAPAHTIQHGRRFPLSIGLPLLPHAVRCSRCINASAHQRISASAHQCIYQLAASHRRPASLSLWVLAEASPRLRVRHVPPVPRHAEPMQKALAGRSCPDYQFVGIVQRPFLIPHLSTNDRHLGRPVPWLYCTLTYLTNQPIAYRL